MVDFATVNLGSSDLNEMQVKFINKKKLKKKNGANSVERVWSCIHFYKTLGCVFSLSQITPFRCLEPVSISGTEAFVLETKNVSFKIVLPRLPSVRKTHVTTPR